MVTALIHWLARLPTPLHHELFLVREFSKVVGLKVKITEPIKDLLAYLSLNILKSHHHLHRISRKITQLLLKNLVDLLLGRHWIVISGLEGATVLQLLQLDLEPLDVL